MAKHKPVLQIRLSVGRIRNLLHCAHPGLLMVLVTVSAVLLWQTFVIHRPTIPLGILVLAQIVAFGCTYRFPIPSLIVFAVLSMAGDAFSPMYSSYALYSVLVAISLWSYFTNDPASAGAALLFSAYQLVWSTNTDTAAAPLTALLFSSMFILAALLGAALRRFVHHLQRQQQAVAQMRLQMLESAEELHDAVSGTLSNVDLMLQYRSHTLLSAPTAADVEQIVELDEDIRTRLDQASQDVAQIVNMLFEQYGETADPSMPTN